MIEPLRPYLAADQVVPVRVQVAGVERSGEDLGWRADRVYVRYPTERGGHLAWVQAPDVHRLTGS